MPTLRQYACFICRKVFKRPHEYDLPDKQGFRGYKFRAPGMADIDEWHRIHRALKEGRDYGIPTVRKQTPKPRLSPQLRIALGSYGKRKAQKAA